MTLVVNSRKIWTVNIQSIEKGHCMLSANYGDSSQVSICNDNIVCCHAISRNQLNLIADNDDDPNHIIAIKERRSFLQEANQGDHLQRTSIGNFCAGNWACKKHENDFKDIDNCQINLSNPENVLNTVLRVVFRHNLLMQLRWIPISKHCQTDLGWQQIIEHVFIDSVSDEEAEVILSEWRDVASAVNSMAQFLVQKIREKNWKCLQIHTCMLKSEPTVAGWGCSFGRYPNWFFSIDSECNSIPVSLCYTTITIATYCSTTNNYCPDVPWVNQGMHKNETHLYCGVSLLQNMVVRLCCVGGHCRNVFKPYLNYILSSLCWILQLGLSTKKSRQNHYNYINSD